MTKSIPRRLNFSQPEPGQPPSTKPVGKLPNPAPQQLTDPRKCCVKYATELAQLRKARKAREHAELEAKKRAGRGRGRLPDGAVYDAKYDQSTMRWTGSLTVSVLGVVRVFHDNRRGVFALMGCLDTQFRKALIAAEQQVEAGASGTGESGGCAL